MRTHTISHVRPVVRRGTDTVIAWVFRLTLAEDDQSIFDDITAEVSTPLDYRPLAAWTRSFLDKVLASAATARHARSCGYQGKCSACLVHLLHQRLDARLAIEERHDFDLESLAP